MFIWTCWTQKLKPSFIFSLTPEVINEDALKTTQRLLIAIANLDFDKTSAGRTTPYTEEVFCFLHRLISIFPQLVERNNKSLTKITECSLNHLLFLLNRKRTDEFGFSKEVLALLMQRIGLANNGKKLLLSIIHLLKSDLRDLKATDVYFGYFQKQNKSLKNNAIVVLWSLIGYLMENVGRNEGGFFKAFWIKIMYETVSSKSFQINFIRLSFWLVKIKSF